ncbi:DUF1499 domain-containing protein [Longimicrobium terrae]|nr:DUF1499 domain-containing protein [Longimicrobium terrae]
MTRRAMTSLAAFLLAGCNAAPRGLATPGGPLGPCPDSPNCVSTDAADAVHAMPPLPFRDTPAAALERARAALLREPRTRIVDERADYLHAESRSRLMRFVDDVEILVDSTAGVVRFRSASRVGRGDMGVNRARMERFTARFNGAPE